MNIITSSMALTLVAGIATSMAVVAADGAAIPERGPIPFAAYDIDGSGAISEQEFQQIRSQRMQARAAEGLPMRRAGKAPAFSSFDTNKDGQLSPEELATGQQTQMQKRQGRMGQGAGMGRGPRMGKNMPAFSEFDLDSDGAITEKEFYEARSQRIGERAKQGYPMKGLRTAPSFADVDGDGNGKLTPEEFAAGQARHKQRMQQ